MEQYATLIIGYRRPDLLAEVLSQLSRQSVEPAHVILVDNGGDADEHALSAFAGRSTLVRRADNPGYGGAVNVARPILADLGIGRLLVLTHDAVFDEDLARGLGAALDNGADVGAVAPLLMLASEPGRVFSAGGRLTRNGRAWNTVVPRSVHDPYDADWIDGAIVMFRVDALSAIDWLDERYFLYFEDVDTSWRLHRAGWRVLVAPAVGARQQPGAHPMYLGIRNMTLFAARAGIGPIRNFLGVARRAAEESVYRMLHGRKPELIAAWRGWRDGRRGLDGKPGDRARG